jgi:hypothetical protein
MHSQLQDPERLLVSITEIHHRQYRLAFIVLDARFSIRTPSIRRHRRSILGKKF